MVCLFAMMAAFFPRIAFLILWLARPTMVNTAFNGWFLPLLGLVFLPFTALMYVLLVQGVGGLYGWDWLWLGVAVLLDISHYAGTGRYRREVVPGYPAGAP